MLVPIGPVTPWYPGMILDIKKARFPMELGKFRDGVMNFIPCVIRLSIALVEFIPRFIFNLINCGQQKQGLN